TAALFAHAIADPVYALDASGDPYPALAVDYPQLSGPSTLVKLRPGLLSARGRALDGHDLVFSLDRARRMGGAPWLLDLPAPTVDRGDPLVVRFATADREKVVQALAQ